LAAAGNRTVENGGVKRGKIDEDDLKQKIEDWQQLEAYDIIDESSLANTKGFVAKVDGATIFESLFVYLSSLDEDKTSVFSANESDINTHENKLKMSFSMRVAPALTSSNETFEDDVEPDAK
jgi:hypothetical protein